MRAETVHGRLSRVLERTGEAITVRELLASSGQDALLLLIVLLLLPNALLAPPVLVGVSAGPVGLFGVQLLFDQKEPWLPRTLLEKEIPKAAIERMLLRAAPFLDRVEAMSRSRIPIATGSAGRRLFGLFAVLAAIIVVLPVPGTNVLPAIGITLMGIGLIVRDGLLVLGGILCGIAGLAVAIAATGLILHVMTWLFGA